MSSSEGPIQCAIVGDEDVSNRGHPFFSRLDKFAMIVPGAKVDLLTSKLNVPSVFFFWVPPLSINDNKTSGLNQASVESRTKQKGREKRASNCCWEANHMRWEVWSEGERRARRRWNGRREIWGRFTGGNVDGPPID